MTIFAPKLSTLRKSPLGTGDGYHPDKIRAALQALYPQIMTKIRFDLAPKPTLAEKAAIGKTGFVPVATRWIIERSNAWMERCKRRVKNSEAHLKSCDGKAQFVFHPIDVEAIVQWMKHKWVL